MKIVRGPRLERGYTIIDNRIIRDRRLSLKARGLMTFLLSQSDEWLRWLSSRGSKRLVEVLAEQTGSGRDATQSAIRELAECGHWETRRSQDSAGKWSTEVILHAVPVGGWPDGDGSATSTEYGKAVPGERQDPSTGYGKPVLGATSTDDQTVTDQTRPPSTGFPSHGFPVPKAKDQDEQLKAAASGDLHQSEEGTRPPEPSADVAKVLDGCGVSRASKAWTRAAADALTQGGTPIEIIGHVMEPVRPNANGEPIRSATAVRLQRLKAWTGPPPPQDSAEFYSELLGEFGPRQPPIEALRPALPDHCGECGDLGAPVNFAIRNKNFRYRQDENGRNRMCTCHPDHPSRKEGPTP